MRSLMSCRPYLTLTLLSYLMKCLHSALSIQFLLVSTRVIPVLPAEPVTRAKWVPHMPSGILFGEHYGDELYDRYKQLEMDSSRDTNSRSNE